MSSKPLLKKIVSLADDKKADNIVALDAPAHGTSGSKIFNAVLYSKFIEVVCKEFKPSILMGHSVGGMAISYF